MNTTSEIVVFDRFKLGWEHTLSRWLLKLNLDFRSLLKVFDLVLLVFVVFYLILDSQDLGD